MNDKIQEWIERAQEVTYWPLLAAGVAVLVVALLILRGRIRRARARRAQTVLDPETRKTEQEKSDQRRLTLIFTMALGINADAMFRALTERAGLQWWFAAPVFAFFEVLQLFFMHRGTRKYKETGRVGNAGLIVWVVAFASSSITLLNAHNPVEMAIRLVLPIIVALVWLLSMETEVEAEEDTQYRWSRDRVLVALRIKEPKSGIDYGKISRESKIKKIVALRYHMDRGGRLKRFREWRLDRMFLRADEVDLAEAEKRLEAVRLTRIKMGLAGGFGSVPLVPAPSGTTGTSDVPPGTELAGTSGTGDRVHRPGTAGTNISGTGDLAGSGTDDMDSGTDTDPDQVRAFSILAWCRQEGRFPTVREARSICAAPGRSMSSQDVALRAREIAQPMWEAESEHGAKVNCETDLRQSEQHDPGE